MQRIIYILLLVCLAPHLHAQRWSVERANNWYARQGWLVGANFIPSTAINQLEMWQAETFDPVTIDKELGWAENIGMNCMRVYLHHAAWVVDQKGFKKRINQYLSIADKHHIKTMFVIFDDCWRDTYSAGKQPDPVPGRHNSGWLKDPGNRVQNNPLLLDTLERYVKDIIGTFRKDDRILLWDLYNEPGQFDQHEKSLPLLRHVFEWAREINPSQPLSAGIHDDGERILNQFQLDSSDIITYHSYDSATLHQRRIDSLRDVVGERPMICTEYMARKRGSMFGAILPMLKKENIGAINWGLVDGKTQTKYAWDEKNWGAGEPALWFHDIFRGDGSAYKKEEVELIKGVTAENIVAISDIEGQYDAFIQLLRAAKVIDKNNQWIFGKGHLVLTGDMVDRGDKVVEVLEFIRSLEKEAHTHGGAVHYILGNHEIMNMSGDFRYVHKKYWKDSTHLRDDYLEMISPESITGQWLHNKNILQQVGECLFVHGGIAPAINASELIIDSINAVAKRYYDMARQYGRSTDPRAQLIFNARVSSPFWYRGYYQEAGEKFITGHADATIDSTLQKFNVSHIVTGHSITGDTVSMHYGGKVFNTDVEHAEGKSDALVIEGEKYYRVNKEREKRRLN